MAAVESFLGRELVLDQVHIRRKARRRATLSLLAVIVLACSTLAGVSFVSPALGATSEVSGESDALGPQTIKLFEAIRTGSLSAVQQSVLDGASLVARGPEGKTAAELAEFLEKYTITLFLRTYESIEQTDDSRVTEQVPAPAAEDDSQTTAAETTVQEANAPEVEPGTIAETVQAPAVMPGSESGTVDLGSDLPVVTLPVVDTPPASQPVAVTQGTQATVTEIPTRSESVPEVAQVPIDIPMGSEDYFSRLSVLNPSPGSEPETETVMAEPVPADSMTSTPESEMTIAESVILEMPEAPVIMDEPIIEPAPEAVPVPGADSGSLSGMVAEFQPPPAPRKPANRESSSESELFAAVEATEPVTAPGVDPETGGTTEMAQTLPEGTVQTGEEESFFSSMRSFSDEQNGLGTGDLTAPPENETTNAMREVIRGLPESVATDLPEHELIRAAVLEKLRGESLDRMNILDEARESAAAETELDEQSKAHETGVQNVQRDLRVQEYLAAVGTTLAPGYVPPPDGGSSAVRFLQRIGVLSGPADTQSAMADEQSPIMSALEEIDPGGVLTIDERASPFVQAGYSAPPAGSSVDTSDDRSVAVLGQMARLFATPGISSPSLLGGIPTPGSMSEMPSSGLYEPAPSSAMAILPAPAPATSVGTSTQIEPSAPVVLPQNPPAPPASDITPIPGTITEANTLETMQPVDSELQQGWEAVASTELSPAGQAPPGSEAGVIDRLAHMFDPENPNSVGSGGAIRDAAGNPPVISESGGSWDVISVQSAPSAARVMLTPPLADGQQPMASNAVLAAGSLTLGQSAILGKGLPMGNDVIAQKKACIQKRQGATTFCIEGLDWSEDIQEQLYVNTVMYQGLNAIVRYDNGVATRYHSLFPSDSFTTIVNHYIARLGQPSNVWQRTITPLAAPARANPTVSWQAYNAARQNHLVLEIRQFDDTRGGFPDEQRGAIMLYNVQAGTIFPQVSAFELMRLRPG